MKLLSIAALLLALPAAAQTCDVAGKIVSGGVPLPGVAVTAANSLTGKKVATTTDVDGSYSLKFPANGRYVLRAELSGFAPTTAEVVVNASACHPRSDMQLTLSSRVQQEERNVVAGGGAPRTAPGAPGRTIPGGQPNANGGARGFQNLSVSGDSDALASFGDNTNGNADATSGMPPQMSSADAATESVAVSGNSGQTDFGMFGGNNEDMQNRIEQLRENARNGGDMGGADFRGVPGMGGGFGGPGGGGGFGGPGGGGPGIRMGGGGGRGGRNRFNMNQPHGNLFYSTDNAALDAKAYSLTGAPSAKPDYMQQRFGASVGGPLNIPHIYNGGTKTFYFINYTGNRSDNPVDIFSTVPTLAERSGNFAGAVTRGRNGGQSVTVINPATGQPFANDQIPMTMFNPAAAALLPYIPLPNLPGNSQNFHFISSTGQSTDNLNIRLMHNFGAAAGPFGGGGGGRRGGGNGKRNNINISFNWQRSNTQSANAFPSISGRTSGSGYNVPIGWTFGKGRFTNNLRFNWNRSQSQTNNAYTNLLNIAGQAGINGVSTDPFDYGLPSLSFSNFSSLRDITPSSRDNQTFSWSDSVNWRVGKHTWRFGGDFRRIYLDTHTDKNPNGNFVFTGLYSGLDFADFLLGYAQQASVQFGAAKYHFSQNSWDLFVEDNWRLRANLTLTLGLRYEYVSPYSERDGRLVNLDVAPGFVAAVPVQVGQTGPYTGTFPGTLVNPDRNNFAPRVGIAWKPMAKTVVRAGYGINYNTGAYGSIVQNLAFQPPFTFTETNIGTFSSPLLLQNAFPALPNTVTNNYAVDRNFRLGYVQMWNLNIQRELSRTLVLQADYTGSKGTHLDMLRAPNRLPNGGLRIPGVQAFLFEDSIADSIMHSGSIRVNKRMSHGLGLGASYTFSKSIDNASSIGGSGSVVAQNDLDLAAERGLSSFDQPHRLSVNYTYELPFGENRHFLATNNLASHILGDWQWMGTFTFASGLPYTARVLNAVSDVASGVNGTLRANLTGQPIALSNPTLGEWFNTAAFTIPAAGQYGDAGRNTIRGPHTLAFNMSLSKNIQLGDVRGLELRVQANNVFNMPQYSGIDTVVNSPTFGQVISVGSMRKLTLFARFHF